MTLGNNQFLIVSNRIRALSPISRLFIDITNSIINTHTHTHTHTYTNIFGEREREREVQKLSVILKTINDIPLLVISNGQNKYN